VSGNRLYGDKKMRKLSLFLALFGSVLYAADLSEKYQDLIQVATLVSPKNEIVEAELLEICRCLHGKPVNVFLKQLSQDSKRAKKEKLDAGFIKKLEGIHAFIKSHIQFFKTYTFHTSLQVKYAFAFDNPNAAQTIQARYQSKLPLHDFMKGVLKDLAEVEKHEDYLHSRYGYLKSRNYALKIELIKIRNSIIYQDEYKDQRATYIRKSWWKAPYKVVEKVCVGSYCVGSYVAKAVTG
jgi:exonuclease V gamma subunit